MLRIAAANLAVAFAFLTLAEVVCRYVEPKTAPPPPVRMTLPPKSASELRVFAFGGSTVAGVPVPEIGFVAQMQYWLRRLYPHRDIRLYNFGWAGVDTLFVLQEVTRRFNDRPDLIIVITGHNEYLGPVGRTARIREILSHFAMVRVAQHYRARMKKSSRSYTMPSQVEPWNREAATFKSGMASFEEYMKLIVERSRQRGVTLIVGTLPSNISDWPPVYKKLGGRDERYGNIVSRVQELLRGGKYRQASDAVTTAFSLYGEDAMLYFLRGQIQSAVGAYADARESFVKARDLDPLPWRATSQINSIIRRVASGVRGVHLVDLERVYEKHATHGLVGFDLIYDNVHGAPLGESIAARAIIHAMTEIGFLPPSRQARGECCPVDAFLADVGFLEPKSPLRLRALLRNATYTMKTPWLNYEVSRRYLLEAMEVDENSWQVWANLATLSYLTGDTATAARELARATGLHGAPLDGNDRESTPYLKEALEVQHP